MLDKSRLNFEVYGTENAAATLVYFPGFGDNELSDARRDFLERLADRSGLAGMNVLRPNRAEISMLSKEGRALNIQAEILAKLAEVEGEFVFMSNSFGADFALSASQRFRDRTRQTLLITPPVGRFERVTKNVLQSSMNCDEVRSQRIWDKFDSTNRAVFSLEDKDLGQAHCFYLTGDRIISPETLTQRDVVLPEDDIGHFDWERSEKLETALRHSI